MEDDKPMTKITIIDEPMTEEEKKHEMKSFSCDFAEDEMLTIYNGKIFEITLSKKELSLCKLICATLDGDRNVQKLELPHIQSKPVIDLVVDFLRHHNGIDLPKTQIDEEGKIEASELLKKPLRSQDMKDLVDEWDANWVNSIPMNLMYDLLHTINYLDMDGIMPLVCAKLAQILRKEEKDAQENQREKKSLDQLLEEAQKKG